MKHLCIIFFILPVILPAQERESIVERRVVPEQEWQKAAGGLDYSRDLPVKPKPKKDRSRPDRTRSSESDWSAMSQFWGNFFQVLAILIACVVIGYGIYWLIRQPRNRRIARDGAEITVDNLDAYIHETDLERFLREALSQQNYPLAVRIYFLQIIKDLSQKGAIRWSKEKTNRDYLREMYGHALAQPFREATRAFEYTWYGNTPLNETEFKRLEPAFKSLLARIG